jgi:hypothetical protein
VLPDAGWSLYATPSKKFQSYWLPTDATGTIALRYLVLFASPRPAVEICVSAS